ncbi:MAG: adenosine deaminase family protein [Calditrichaeota bacterium]|nr:adenosine deaminase family protein [Calditrichota bacterium]
MNSETPIVYSDEIRKLIERIPKTDIHVHLDGCVHLATLIEIAEKEKIDLPSYTVEGMNELVFKDHYENLEEYLKTFGFSCAVMQKPEYLERIAYEMAQDNQAEGVRYMEVRFAPQLHINDDMDMAVVLTSVNKGLERAQKEFNQQPEVTSGKEPPFNYGIIISALRSFGPYSDYYAKFIHVHSFSEKKQLFGLASAELVQGAVRVRDELGLPIVAFDLAGAEKGNPPKDHWRAFQFAHENFMSKTVHAGEAYGAPSIFQAITELHADRIGHGFYLFDESKIDDPRIKDKQRYINELAQYIAEHRVTIEVNLTSNLQTIPTLKTLKNHSFHKMLEYELSTTICTDNRTVSKTTVTNELVLALQNFNLSPRQLKNVIVYGFKRSFFPDNYSKKRQYVRRCIDYYEHVVKGTPLEA